MTDGFWAIHSGLDREGPGSAASTRRALSLVPDLSGPATVLDLGSGPGAQTLTLAEALPQATIVAVDAHGPFVEAVGQRAAAAGVADRVIAVQADMADVDALRGAVPGGGRVDAIWSEGAAYAIGFEHALAIWRDLLAPGGVLGLTEPVWTLPTVPQAVRDFWDEAYPGMQPPQVRRAQAMAAGYRRVGDFLLPREDWAGYYDPIRARLEEMAPRAADDTDLSHAIAETRREIEIWEAGGDRAVGYLFLVLRREG